MVRQQSSAKVPLTAANSNGVDYQLWEKRGRIERIEWVPYTLVIMITSKSVAEYCRPQLIMTYFPSTWCSLPDCIAKYCRLQLIIPKYQALVSRAYCTQLHSILSRHYG